ncbi:MAG: sulfurtransferase TusE [Gammaproteobacteria bacterium]|nr:MAG: sulfurtransferase TusE [Gammaproteobacteria bacterium]
MSALIDSLETDREGYLRHREDWCRELAEELAAADGITLTEAHWEVIGFLQEYHDNYEIAPAMRILTKQMGKRFGKEKGNSRYLYELFPRGPARQASRYAGLPKPTGCTSRRAM